MHLIKKQIEQVNKLTRVYEILDNACTLPTIMHMDIKHVEGYRGILTVMVITDEIDGNIIEMVYKWGTYRIIGHVVCTAEAACAAGNIHNVLLGI